MAAALPVTKLAGLLVKTFAKPLSKRIKHDFARFDATKKMLIGIGQTNHTVTSYMTIWASGYRVKSIRPIDAEKALKIGAEFVGEGFVLTVSMAIVVFEYNRSAQSNARKDEQKRERIKATQVKLQAKLNTLDIRIKAVEDLIKQQQHIEDNKSLLNRVVPVVGGTGKPKYIEPPKEKLVPIADDDQNDDETDRDAFAVDVAATTTTTSTCCNIIKREEKPQNETGKEVTADLKSTEPSESTAAVSSISSEDENQQRSWWKFW